MIRGVKPKGNSAASRKKNAQSSARLPGPKPPAAWKALRVIQTEDGTRKHHRTRALKQNPLGPLPSSGTRKTSPPRESLVCVTPYATSNPCCIRPIKASECDGSHRSSESRNIRTSPLDAATPWFLAAPGPRPGVETSLTLGYSALTAAAVPSREPSSTTITSDTSRSWLITLPRARRTISRRSLVGMMQVVFIVLEENTAPHP